MLTAPQKTGLALIFFIGAATEREDTKHKETYKQASKQTHSNNYKINK